VAGVVAEARAIDERLRVFDPEADREGFCLHVHAARVQHLERVARAVADGEHDVAACERLAARESQRPSRVPQ
jgi:hypothetical protein